MMDKYIVPPLTPLKEAVIRLDAVSGVGLVVLSAEKKLLGTITDGDIRRALIRGHSMDSTVESVMCSNPESAPISYTYEQLKSLSKYKEVKVIPVVEKGTVIDVFVRDDESFDGVPVVLMAGGLGSRLGSETKNCPKPMLKVGGKPILERIIEGFTKVGFEKFFISVNYKAEIIEDYFKNGQRYNCSIKYLKEDKRMGTAGSLSLLPSEISGPVIVMNGDLLSDIDFRRLLSFHKKHSSPITICVKGYEFQVPYGVVNFKDGKACSFNEKPIHSFNVNAGVYVIDTSLFKYIPQREYFDMSSFLDILIKNDIHADCFPIIEKWIDVGQRGDLENARSEYDQ